MKHIGYMLVGMFLILIPATFIILFPALTLPILGLLFILSFCYYLGKAIVEIAKGEY